MKSHDVRLIDPPADELVRQLEKATKTANGRLRNGRIEQDEAFWHRLVAGAARQREGGHTYLGKGAGSANAPLVRVAWWTDHVGRRHWRVVGGRRSGAEGPANPLEAEPLYQVYPDRVLLRQHGERTELIAVCQCGAVGPPAALGWAGDCCGPCHDRREEGGPPAVGPDPCPTLTGHTELIRQLAFTADGRLVSGGMDGRLMLWNLRTGTRRVLVHRPGQGFEALAVSATGRVAACLSISALLLGRLEDDELQVHPLPTGSPLHLQFTPDGGRLAVVGWEGVWVYDPDDLTTPQLHQPLSLGIGVEVALLPDGQSIVTGRVVTALRVVDLRTGDVRPLPDPTAFPLGMAPGENLYAASPLECSADGRWVATAAIIGGHTELHLHHLPSGECHVLPHAAAGVRVEALQFTPDGCLAALGPHHHVSLWDVERRQLLGTLMLPPGFHDRVAFSPDGEWLALAESVDIGRGPPAIHVWPWRRILEGRA